MESILIKALQLILSLSILVIVHELGHFLFSKLFKVRVEKFYLFFNPWFSLFKYKPKNSDTEYGIGWLPLGGYVKISGMMDESMDKEQLAQPVQPHEFRAKPAWQRLLIMVGGVLMNIVLALVIYSAIVFTWGDIYTRIDKTPVYFSDIALNAGFRDGDMIITADGRQLKRYDKLELFNIIDGNTITVLRDGVEKSLILPENFAQQILESQIPFVDTAPTVVDSVIPEWKIKLPFYKRWFNKSEGDIYVETPAQKAGLKAGDRIISVNGSGAIPYGVFASILKKNKGREVNVIVLRDSVQVALNIQVDKDGKIGFVAKSGSTAVRVRDEHGFWGSIKTGTYLFARDISFYVLQLKLVFSRAGLQSLGGFGAIGDMFPPVWDWYSFWNMTALLSIMLAVMNLLPIPALDGGHVMFLLYEVVTRRKPSDKFMERAQMVGMILLISLLLYANGNDIFRFLF